MYISILNPQKHLKKQPPCSVKRCSSKLQKFDRKTPLLESVLDQQLYQKETPTQVFSCKICKTFKNTYFEEHMRTTSAFPQRCS